MGAPTARPTALTRMPPFVGDVLDPARTHGDLLLHVEADDVDAARKRARGLVQGLEGLNVRWQLDGRRPGTFIVTDAGPDWIGPITRQTAPPSRLIGGWEPEPSDPARLDI